MTQDQMDRTMDAYVEGSLPPKVTGKPTPRYWYEASESKPYQDLYQVQPNRVTPTRRFDPLVVSVWAIGMVGAALMCVGIATVIGWVL